MFNLWSNLCDAIARLIEAVNGLTAQVQTLTAEVKDDLARAREAAVERSCIHSEEEEAERAAEPAASANGTHTRRGRRAASV